MKRDSSGYLLDIFGRRVKCADCGREFKAPSEYRYRYGPPEKAGRSRYAICRREMP